MSDPRRTIPYNPPDPPEWEDPFDMEGDAEATFAAAEKHADWITYDFNRQLDSFLNREKYIEQTEDTPNE